MNFVPGNLYHVYNQGNNKQHIFLCDEDYLIFLRLTRKLICTNADIIAYCLMPNHFHFILYANERSAVRIKQGGIFIDAAANAIRKLLSGNARIFNDKYERSGSLFRQKTKAKLLTENLIVTSGNATPDYPLECFNYIHENPVSAGLTKKKEDWIFSSYLDYAGLRSGTLCNKQIANRFGLNVDPV